jgi:hypothetical protein
MTHIGYLALNYPAYFPEERLWPTSGLATIRELMVISAFLGTDPKA